VRPEAASNVLSILREVARQAPERPALVMRGVDGLDRGITFASLWQRIDSASLGLRQMGLQPGDRAIVMVPMSIDLYVALLALLKIGAVAVFVDPWIGWRQIAAFAAFAEPRAYVGIPKSHLLRLLSPRLRAIPLTVTTGGRWGSLPAAHTLAELEAEPGTAGNGAVQPVAPGDSALITFTSGSSGEPKGADRTHGFLIAQHRALAAELPAAPGDVDMPMFPVFALNNLATGVPSIVPAMDFRRVDQVDAATVLGQMESHGVTTCTASPPFFDRIAAHLLDMGGDPPPLRRILTGGAPVSDAQLRTWRQALPETEIVVAYGSTEAEPVAHIGAEERLAATSDVRPASPGYCAGWLSERVRARVIRIHPGPVELPGSWEGWALPHGEIGELVVTGDHVCKSYFRNDRAVRENKIVDAADRVWHRMGDTGYFDGEGRFWIAGRVHSTIRRDGQMVHPQLVEQAARGEDPRVRRAAAVGLPDASLGERVALVLETDAGEELEQDVHARLAAASQVVDQIIRTSEALPVDPRHNSKIDYPRLRSDLMARRR
jgi:acyl-CoA synthetase (AMP-forming)/AMP-acid ligase II